jgi:hypothetical protein
MSTGTVSHSNSKLTESRGHHAALWALFAKRARRTVVFVWKYAVGMALCQSIVGSIMVVGWTYRLMQRTVLKQWWKRSHCHGSGKSFAGFLSGNFRTQGHINWPNWVVRQNAWMEIRNKADEGSWSQLRTVFKAALPSLWLNLKTGAQGILNTWVLTLPGCILWLFAWYDGWNNSFNKGYEQAAVGPLTGIAGVILFIGAMFYVPMAQARQAATGQWKSFYQFRLIWGLIRRQWLAGLGLAVLYAAFSLPVTILKTVPAFFPQMNATLHDASPVQALGILKTYFFWASLVVFPAYVILRLVAARIYANAVFTATQKGTLPEDALAEIEWEALHRLDLLEVRPEPPRHVLVRAVTWAGSRAGRVTSTVLLVLVWFGFVAQIFTSEFFNYHPAKGWLNQPLVQLPWFNYIPSHLKSKGN